MDAQNFSQGSHDDATRLIERAIEVGEKTLGPEHPDLATRLKNLAGNLKFQVGC